MSEIYRDRSEGAVARRQELLRRRRDELVTMPHAVRRVVVARSARIAAGMFATLAGAAVIAAAWSPALAERIEDAMPGIQPAPLSTLLFGAWIFGVVAWAIGRARFEHRFAVAMSTYVLPTNDVDRDVERLDHEHPDDIARDMGHALEVRSAAWPILAIAALLPATALWCGLMARSGGDWPVVEFEDGLAQHASTLAWILAAGALGAIAMTRKAMRRPAVGMSATPLALITLGLCVVGAVQHTALAWTLAGVGAIGVAIAVMARKLRRERALLEIDDPAAGSELFTIRGAIRQVRAGLAIARSALLSVRRRYWVMLLTAGVISTAIGLLLRPREPAPLTPAPPTPALAIAAAAEPAPVVEPAYRTEPSQPTTVMQVGSRLEVTVRLDDDGAAVVPLSGFVVVPQAWQAVLFVEHIEGGPVTVVGSGATARVGMNHHSARVSIEACAGPRPFALRLTDGPARQPVTLYVTPSLTVDNCRSPAQ